MENSLLRATIYIQKYISSYIYTVEPSIVYTSCLYFRVSLQDKENQQEVVLTCKRRFAIEKHLCDWAMEFHAEVTSTMKNEGSQWHISG